MAPSSEQKLHFGKTGFPGLALGKAFVFARQKIEIPETKIQDVAQEIVRFKASIQKVISHLHEIKSRQTSSKNSSSEAQEILEAHLLMLEDPEWILQIEEKIQNQKFNAMKSVFETGLEFKTMMENLDDEYLRARAQDIMDLTYQVVGELSGQAKLSIEPQEDYILVAQDLLPSEFLKLSRSRIKGMILENVSTTSHTVILAKTFEIPLIVAFSQGPNAIHNGDFLGVDALKGQVVVSPDEKTKDEFHLKIQKQKKEQEELQKFSKIPSISKDGISFEVASNLSSVMDAELAKGKGTEGCGLFRTEFLLMDRHSWPTEEEQTKIYSEVVKLMAPHKTIIRLFDVGGDKSLPYLELTPEENPFLGLRGLRLLLKFPHLLKQQIRALIKASAYGPLGVMAPMVTTPGEIKEFRKVFDECQAELHSEGFLEKTDEGRLAPRSASKMWPIEIGIMVEVPSIALVLREMSSQLDFISVGTNDLIQYLCATDRMNSEVAHLHDAFNPGVLRFLKLISDQLKGTRTWMGMCGELAGLSGYVPLLMALGFKELSVSPGALLKTRAKVISTSVAESKILLEQALEKSDRDSLKALVEQELTH